MGLFKGMVGRVLAKQQLKNANRNNGTIGNNGTAGGHTGKFLFVAHPNCCPKCQALGMTPHFFNTPDVAYITHPNCLCATIEVPAGLNAEEVMQWAQHPVGFMQSGWSYGIPLKKVNLTEENFGTEMEDWNRRALAKERAIVSSRRIKQIRQGIKDGKIKTKATDLTKRYLPKKRVWNPNKTTQDYLDSLDPNRVKERLKAKYRRAHPTPINTTSMRRSYTPAAPMLAFGAAMALAQYNKKKRENRRKARALRGDW